MAPRSFFLCTLLIISLSFHGISAVEYHVINDATTTPGGIRFDNEIGIPFTKKIMRSINDFIWSVENPLINYGRSIRPNMDINV
ncbi:hypothetical protein Ccrd_019832 [Cynara cardunculus var. scolymus]|uniref:Uncharacterized protein n=1 Tax=Cynara cardunculus var. scolymus TaxID=59895 RepID=A0A118K157_CYNCS|nr:hypothetical protein Ccrd_019832 [Cynara cardunculus var. scolymus]